MDTIEKQMDNASMTMSEINFIVDVLKALLSKAEEAVEMGTAVEAIMEITHKMAQRNGLPIPEEISGKIENIRTEMAKAREATKQCPVIISKLSKILELQE